LDKARHAGNQGGFAASRKSDYGNEFTFFYGQIDIVQNMSSPCTTAVAFAETFDFTNRHAWYSPL